MGLSASPSAPSFADDLLVDLGELLSGEGEQVPAFEGLVEVGFGLGQFGFAAGDLLLEADGVAADGGDLRLEAGDDRLKFGDAEVGGGHLDGVVLEGAGDVEVDAWVGVVAVRCRPWRSRWRGSGGRRGWSIV